MKVEIQTVKVKSSIKIRFRTRLRIWWWWKIQLTPEQREFITAYNERETRRFLFGDQDDSRT